MGMRGCTKCGLLYWPPERYFYVDKSRKDGFCLYCKSCASQYQKGNRESINKIKREWRRANIERLRPLRRERLKEWRADNREIYLEDRRDYYQRNRDRELRRARQWKLNNSDWIIAYEQTPKAKANRAVQNARRREERKLADLTEAEWAHVLENQGHVCLGCGREFGNELSPERDHIIPVAKGGVLTKTNVQALCRSCNARKGPRV